MRITTFLIPCMFVASIAAGQSGQPKILPTPKTADGKPDLTGVYQASPRRGGWDAEAPGDEPGVAAPRQAVAINQTSSDPIPFRPEARARAQELLNRRSIDDPAGHCLFLASPRITGVGLFPIQFVQTPTQMIVLYEYLSEFRVIPIAAKHPDDLSPSFIGDSIGRWEGNTFVVDVVGFKPGWMADRRARHERRAAPDRAVHAHRSRSAQLRSDDRRSKGADEAVHAADDADAARRATPARVLVRREQHGPCRLREDDEGSSVVPAVARETEVRAQSRLIEIRAVRPGAALSGTPKVAEPATDPIDE
jgi:hypothetical protein